jgi:hypothetical protein
MDVELMEADRFLRCLAESVDQNYAIKDRPNPPDFVFSLGDTEMWLEVTDIFLSNEQAKFQKPSTGGSFTWNAPVDETSRRMFEKLSKTSYKVAFEKYGPGILLLTCRDFGFGAVDLGQIARDLNSFSPVEDQGFFKRAYFEYCFEGQRVYRVAYPRDEALTDWAAVA